MYLIAGFSHRMLNLVYFSSSVAYQQIILIMQVHVHVTLTLNPCPPKIIGIPLPNSKPAEKTCQTVMTIHKSIVHVPYVQHHVKG